MRAIDDQAAIEFGSLVWDDQTYVSCPLYFLVLEFPTAPYSKFSAFWRGGSSLGRNGRTPPAPLFFRLLGGR
jgi:hypothetical protein